MDPEKNKIESVGNWSYNVPKSFKQFNGTRISQIRNVSLSFYANGMYPNVKENQTVLMGPRTPTNMKIFVVIKNRDLIYSNYYRVNLLFEIKTPDVLSSQVAVRISSKMAWKKNQRPSIIGGLIENQYRSKVSNILMFYSRWAPEKLEEHDKMDHWE